MTAKHLIVSGRVQGVGYRDWLVAQASAMGVQGWVRNRRDGAVEALLAGNEEAVDELIRTCWRGPRAADVKSIAVEPGEPPATAGFVRMPTL